MTVSPPPRPGSAAILGRSLPLDAVAGCLLLLAGAGVLMGIITAESLFPEIYTTHANEISDLGRTQPPDDTAHQPSAAIFNVTMIVTGAMIVAAAYALYRRDRSPLVPASIALMGIGLLGVGVFPGNYSVLHGIFAGLTFVSGGTAAILSSRMQTAPFRYVSIGLGVISLGALAFYQLGTDTRLFEELGEGGAERWITYPVVIWQIAFGAYLMASESANDA